MQEGPMGGMLASMPPAHSGGTAVFALNPWQLSFTARTLWSEDMCQLPLLQTGYVTLCDR